MPAANVQGQDPNEMTPAQEWMVRRLVTSDFLYWSARKLAPKKLIGFLLATGPALLDDIVRDQRLNIAVMMPLAVAFQGLSWWLVHACPQAMLEEGWHLLLIGLTLLFSVNYLYGGVRLLRRRQDWILARAAQERAES